MKEKIIGLVKQPLFLVGAGAALLAVVFGVIATLSAPKPTKVVEEFCEEFQEFNEEAMIGLMEPIVGMSSSLYNPKNMVDDLMKQVDPETDTIKYTIGNSVPDTKFENCMVVTVLISVYEKKELKDVFCVEFRVSEGDGKDVIRTAWLEIIDAEVITLE